MLESLPHPIDAAAAAHSDDRSSVSDLQIDDNGLESNELSDDDSLLNENSDDDLLNKQKHYDYLSETDEEDRANEFFPMVTGDTRKSYELTDDELLKLFPFHRRYINKEKIIQTVLPTLRLYLREVAESQGFDIEHFPGFIMGLTSISPLEYAGNFIESEDTYLELAEFALAEYNEEHGTMYGYAEVEKVNLDFSNYNHYYITFTAELVDGYDDEDEDDETDDDDVSKEEIDDGGKIKETDACVSNKGTEAGRSKEEGTDACGSNKGTDAGRSKEEETDVGGSKEGTDSGGSNKGTDAGISQEELIDAGGKTKETDVCGTNKGTDAGRSKEEETDANAGGKTEETDVCGSNKGTDAGRSKEEETDANAGGSDEIGVRKVFQAMLSRDMIGKHMPEVKFCRLKTMPKPN